MVNEGIRARELRLIADDGSQLGVKSKQEALKLAEQANLDLVLVAPKAKPPVAKIMDYGNPQQIYQELRVRSLYV